MKKMNIKSMFLGLGLIGAPIWAANSLLVEVPIQKVFIPKTGFDDNDTVEAVVDGFLPNACYVLANQKVDIDTASKNIKIKQYALRLTSGTCKEGSLPTEPELVTPIPYTETVALGQLDMGEYRVEYHNSEGRALLRNFNVASSPVPTLDSEPYAMVTEVRVEDMIRTNQDIEIEIQGILNNSCYSLNEKIGVQKLDDVIVLLPTVKIVRGQPCLMVTRPFLKKVNAGQLTRVNRFLVHVRSMQGKSLNRVFATISPPVR